MRTSLMPTGIGRSQYAMLTSAYDGERTNASKAMIDGCALRAGPPSSGWRPVPSLEEGRGSEWRTLTSFQRAWILAVVVLLLVDR
jgi:hypothetical protein